MTDKIELLRRLVSWQLVDLDTVTDSPKETVLLRGSHLKKMLQNYLDGQVNKDYLETWANIILSRNDIIREEQNAPIIDELLYRFSNFDTEGDLTQSQIEGCMISFVR